MKEKPNQDLNNCPNNVRLMQEVYFAVDCETSHLDTIMNDNIWSDITSQVFSLWVSTGPFVGLTNSLAMQDKEQL